ALGQALTGLLRDRGVTVVAPGAPADAALVVGARDTRPADPAELGSSWSELGDLMRTLPQRAGVLWASFGGADLHSAARTGHGTHGGGTGPDPV
ncbi:hypothetical protein GT043_34200, partial [Streptomyces sp. SID2131]|nr:hypothetical protein [Streptomyces sp. SID2131]